MSFIPYPDIDAPDFHDKIFWKKEFLNTMYRGDFPLSTSEEQCSRGEFKMQKHQEFIRNFISPETPYNGALLFHGTGVGKTCAAIGCTEGLRDYVHKSGKKIYILSSENIRPNFYKELYDADRERVEHDIHAIPGSFQCSGDRYYVDYNKTEVKARAIKDMIREYYVFKGFGQFANFVDVELGAELPAHMTKPKMLMEDGSNIDIGDYFSNSVIVIDEAHGIAGEDKGTKGKDDSDDDDDSEDGKKTKSKGKAKAKKVTKKAKKKSNDQDDQDDQDDQADEPESDDEEESTDKNKKKPRNITKRSLFQVLVESIIPACRAKHANLKIILLTATPMKDDVRELGNLLQILNENDGRKMKDGWKNRLFPKGMMRYTNLEQAFTPAQEVELMHYARGYISFVKGDNPITFPKALLPPPDQLYEPGKRLNPNEMNPIYSYSQRDEEDDVQDRYNITSPENFRFNLVKCEMGWYQYLCYKALLNKDIPNASQSSDTYPRMISNMAFPIISVQGGRVITPFSIIEQPDIYLNGDTANGGLLGVKDKGVVRAVHGNKGFDYTFRARQQIVPGTENNVSPKKYVSYSINEDVWEHCGFFMMIENNPGSSDNNSSSSYDLGLFSKKLEIFVRNINNSPGIAYAYSEFVQAGAIVAALALEANGYVRYHPNIKQHINANTGLPKDTIRTALPECFLLNLTTQQIQRLPDKPYRCSVCGQYYNDCIKSDDHKFNLATYVVVTGKQGGIKEIAEAVSNNKNGEKIKVVIGTKVTGTGVDFKWIRQVHILDPWHNNTRIFQAIGRGLRHCSHADLPPEKRNVTIFKYVSTTDVSPIKENGIDIEDEEQLDSNVTLYIDEDEYDLNVTYRDLLTETVDEHMYRRVVRKDLVIKLIERVLKRIAIDCEFNRNRNMFPGAVDYSRECDYMKCAYTCEGFVNPIAYVRRIRLYENGDFYYVDANDMEHPMGDGDSTDLPDLLELEGTNADLWDRYRRNSMMIEGNDRRDAYQDLLVDIPIPNGNNKIDSSTYNIHFSAPQIDKAVKLIGRLFQKTQALRLEKIVHLVRKLNPLLDVEFIYSALDKIVGKPPYIKPLMVIDKFGRQGKIIVHNNVYIYHPLELNDERIPMGYRSKPLTIKSRFYNMDRLTAREVKKTVKKAVDVDPAQVKEMIKTITEMTITDISGIVELHTMLYDLLLAELANVLEIMVINNSDNLQYVMEYCMQSGMLFYLSNDDITTITELIVACRKGKKELVHIMNSANTGTINVRVFKRDKWVNENIDNRQDFLVFEGEDTDVPDIRFPHSDLTMHLKKLRKVLTPLNTFDPIQTEPVEPWAGVYGMMSKPIHRKSQPIFQNSTIRNILLNAVTGYNREYPDYDTLKSIQFKVFDQNNSEISRTKTQDFSKRGLVRGIVCKNTKETEINKWVHFMYDIIKDNLDILNGSPDYDEDGNPITYNLGAYMEMLNISVVEEKKGSGVYTLAVSSKPSLCSALKTLLIVANYYCLHGVKWFLNPIDTVIYRPY